ncbi:MAG: DUF6465 family protein [Butyrivibrio sp.]|nr:DUF6465 family protein [Butyrivibrio sp.]
MPRKTTATEVREAVKNTGAKAAETVKEAAGKTAEKVAEKAAEVKEAAKAETKKVAEKAATAKNAVKAAAKKTAVKAAEKKSELISEVYVQFGGREANVDGVIAKATELYVADGHRASSIKSLQVYLKPEESAAYYVINKKYAGRVELF